jgi:CheY-like chemotaxis protein
MMRTEQQRMTLPGACDAEHPRRGGNVAADPRFPFGRKVLITEDNWLIASEWEMSLLNAGYAVLGIAVSADEVIDMCRHETPDLILMDIRLVGARAGIHAAIEARHHFDVPSVFVSAHNDAGTRGRAAPARPIGWITKPVDGAKIPQLLVQLARAARN